MKNVHNIFVNILDALIDERNHYGDIWKYHAGQLVQVFFNIISLTASLYSRDKAKYTNKLLKVKVKTIMKSKKKHEKTDGCIEKENKNILKLLNV